MFQSPSKTQRRGHAGEALAKVGSDLRRLRVKRGERIEDVADYLGIKSTYLFSIEQGDLSILPNRHTARTYMSTYASYLGLDGDMITLRLASAIRDLGDGAQQRGMLSKLGLDRISAGILTTSIVGGTLIGWSYLGDTRTLDLIASPVTADVVTKQSESDRQPSLDNRTAPPTTRSVLSAATGQDAQPASAAISSETEKAAIALAGLQNDPSQTTAPQRQERPANVLATLVAKRGDGAQIYEPQNTDARVIVRALNTSWVQVSSRDRSYLWTRTMQPREMLLVPNRNDIELWAGDAGGIEVLLDGVILPPLGPPGAVIRGALLAPASLEKLAATFQGERGQKPTF